MEILVLSTLEWKMNPVTPLSFLDCIATKLGLFTHISTEFLIRRCHCLLLSLLSGTVLTNLLSLSLISANSGVLCFNTARRLSIHKLPAICIGNSYNAVRD